MHLLNIQKYFISLLFQVVEWVPLDLKNVLSKSVRTKRTILTILGTEIRSSVRTIISDDHFLTFTVRANISISNEGPRTNFCPLHGRRGHRKSGGRTHELVSWMEWNLISMKQMCSKSTGSNRIKTGSESEVDQKWTGSWPEVNRKRRYNKMGR